MKFTRYFFVFLIIFACSGKSSTRLLKNYQINLPENLEVHYRYKGESIIDPPLNNNANVKLITFISGDCIKCIYNMKLWENFISEMGIDNKSVAFYFVINVMDPVYFKDIIFPEISFAYPFLVDTKNEIYGLNPKILNTPYKTFLVDKDFKIKLAGNPLFDNKSKDAFMAKIRSMESPIKLSKLFVAN